MIPRLPNAPTLCYAMYTSSPARFGRLSSFFRPVNHVDHRLLPRAPVARHFLCPHSGLCPSVSSSKALAHALLGRYFVATRCNLLVEYHFLGRVVNARSVDALLTAIAAFAPGFFTKLRSRLPSHFEVGPGWYVLRLRTLSCLESRLCTF